MRDLVFIAVGGAFGALARHAANLAAGRWFGSTFPLGTLTVNVVGCFIIGVAAQILTQLDVRHPPADPPDTTRALLKYGLAVGFLGALTTFSSFSLETFRLAEANRFDLAAANVGMNLLLSLAAVVGGIAVVRAIA